MPFDKCNGKVLNNKFFLLWVQYYDMLLGIKFKKVRRSFIFKYLAETNKSSVQRNWQNYKLNS